MIGHGFALEIVEGLSFDAYRARDALSISTLKEMRRSPRHYRYALAHPKDTEPFALGRAAHCAVLEPARFAAEYTSWERRTSGGKMAPRKGKHWDAFVAANVGKSIITVEQYAEAIGMRDAIREHPEAAKYLGEGTAEVSMFWEQMGRACRGRVDWLHRSERFGTALVGVKSTQDCRLFQFSRQAGRMAYHLQWAFYADGWKRITGRPADRVVEICVEAKPPHAVGVYVIPDEVLQRGSEEYLQLLETLDQCERGDRWPGPNPTEQVLPLPSYMYNDDIEEISYAV